MTDDKESTWWQVQTKDRKDDELFFIGSRHDTKESAERYINGNLRKSCQRYAKVFRFETRMYEEVSE